MDAFEALTYFDQADMAEISRLQGERSLWLERPSNTCYQKALAQIKHLRAKHLDFSGDCICIGQADEISAPEREKLYQALRVFMPWRKGPFRVFGIDIDAEWRSNRKWQRLKGYLPDLTGKIIADVGCNNGYYMFRMAHHKPALVLGFDPTVQFYYTFQALNQMAQVPNIRFELLGLEHLKYYQGGFDVVFLMGILYHHPSPLEILKEIYSAMKPESTLIIETQGIEGDLPLALFPARRYAKVPGTYFIPTPSCLENFVRRAGFRDIELFDMHKMSEAEQRRTDWMQYESYTDFLDPHNPELTVEGYPAPLRMYLRARV